MPAAIGDRSGILDLCPPHLPGSGILAPYPSDELALHGTCRD